MNVRAQSDLKRFLLVFLGAICGGFVLTALMLYYYSPSGQYQVKNVLLSPETLQALSYPETDKGMKATYVFDRISFSYYDTSQKSWQNVPVSLSQYRSFYSLISSDKSIEDDVEEAFRKSPPSRLSIFVRPQKVPTENSDAKELLQVQLLNGGDFYRIQLRQKAGDADWAYFYHPKIDQLALEKLRNKP